ncbi:MAG: Protein translocase membrane subunit SecG, partial [Olavius algarvensis Delta 4 endosymbiont]
VDNISSHTRYRLHRPDHDRAFPVRKRRGHGRRFWGRFQQHPFRNDRRLHIFRQSNHGCRDYFYADLAESGLYVHPSDRQSVRHGRCADPDHPAGHAERERPGQVRI